MRSQNLHVTKVVRKRKLYLSKGLEQNDPSSNSSTPSESLDDSSDDLVCTNCVERDYYLAQFCNELFYSPSSAIQHLEELIKNPEFPKGDLNPPELEYSQSPLSIAVPVTTYTCEDCNPLDERSPQKRYDIPKSHCQVRHTEILSVPSVNYEKRRREIERELINNIYELVCDPEQQRITSANPCRVTKLHVSEMAIERMENIEKINYFDQIERIKLKLLMSYRAFETLDQYMSEISVVGYHDLLETVPYRKKIKDLEKSLHMR